MDLWKIGQLFSFIHFQEIHTHENATYKTRKRASQTPSNIGLIRGGSESYADPASRVAPIRFIRSSLKW